jgi:hypothetical protein
MEIDMDTNNLEEDWCLFAEETVGKDWHMHIGRTQRTYQ